MLINRKAVICNLRFHCNFHQHAPTFPYSALNRLLKKNWPHSLGLPIVSYRSTGKPVSCGRRISYSRCRQCCGKVITSDKRIPRTSRYRTGRQAGVSLTSVSGPTCPEHYRKPSPRISGMRVRAVGVRDKV